MTKKIRDVRGSTGAGKTIGITIWDIDLAHSLKNMFSVVTTAQLSYTFLMRQKRKLARRARNRQKMGS